ncbi:hypothetical protein Tco_1306471, partial [Tanacetum coccineum]
MFSIVSKPVYGIIYKNSKEEKKVMRHQEVHKFCDATLKRVLEGLKSYNNDVKYGYVTHSLNKEDVEYLQVFAEEVEERLKYHDQMRRWEIYYEREKINEFTNTGLTQLEKQPPDILTHTQALGTLEALDNVRIRYASGYNVPSIGAPTSIFVLPFGGVLASEEMLNLLGVSSANCPTHNTQLYLSVFQKCSEFHGGNLRRKRTTTFRGTPSAADVMRVDYERRNLKSTNVADIFQAYSALCSRGIGGRRSINVCQTTTVSSSNFIHENGEATYSRGIGGRRSVNVRQTTTVRGSNFIHNNDARNTGPSTSRGGRNTRANPEVSLTTTEATYISSISRRHSVRRRPTVGSNSTAGAVFVKCVVTCFLQGPRTLILETLISVVVIMGLPFGSLCPPQEEAPRFLQLYIYDTDNEVENRMRHFDRIHNSDLDPHMVEGLNHFLDAYNELVQLFRTTRDKFRELDIPEFKIRLYNCQSARGYEFPTSNTLSAMVFESGITSNTDFDVIIQHKDGPTQRVN